MTAGPHGRRSARAALSRIVELNAAHGCACARVRAFLLFPLVAAYRMAARRVRARCGGARAIKRDTGRKKKGTPGPGASVAGGAERGSRLIFGFFAFPSPLARPRVGKIHVRT